MTMSTNDEWLTGAAKIAAEANAESVRENELDSAMQFAEIRAALDIVTHQLTDAQNNAVYTLVRALSSRMACEDWGREKGWEIPPYGTPEWQLLCEASLGDPDDEDED